MALFSQEKRHITISTPLGKDVLLVQSMKGTEGISRLFNFELSLLSENQAISFEDILGKGVTVAIALPWGKKRLINGIVSRFAQTSGAGTSLGDIRTSSYSATIVPWVWLLSRSAESKIYQNLSVPEIAERIFKNSGFCDFEMRLQRTYGKREYCVQYRESHFDFLSRLLEDEGINYFFRHLHGRHELVLADSAQAHAACPEQGVVCYQTTSSTPSAEGCITSLEKIQEIRPTKYSLTDFNFEIPNTSLNVNLVSKVSSAPSLEIYDYPGEYRNREEGDRLARVRLEQEETQVCTISGSSNCRAFASGYRFTLNNGYRTDMDGKDFLLTSITHEVTQDLQSGGRFDYRNSFTCIPAEVPFRPPRLTPKPVLNGSQTAVVVGPAGEEIHTDRLGRVKVQFHWDREGQKDEKTSCWIRVSQVCAGTNWGVMFLPRIGQEVIVDFLEGNPDRPVITGAVYNGLNLPPYPLPEGKTKSFIKSNSSSGGGGCNEICFEDKKGNEQLLIQAERQQDVRVKKDALEWIGNDRHLIVINDKLESIGGDKHLAVTGDVNEKVDGTLSIIAGLDVQQRVGAKHAVEAGEEIHLKAGVKLVLEAGVRLSLRAGGNFIDIGPAGVTVNGARVMINSGGSAASGSGASPDVPKAPKEAGKADPGASERVPPAQPKSTGPQAAALKSAAVRGAPFCDT